MSTCNLESDHPSCKHVVTLKSNYCSWPAWPWRQRHYNPSKWRELLAQQHSITILQSRIYSIQDSCWLTVLTSHVWDVTVCISKGADVWGEGITSICMANHDTHHHTPADCNPRYSNNTTSTWIKIDQLDVTYFIISLFNAQHVLNVSTTILRSLWLICWVISWVVLLWFNVCWCYSVVRLGWCSMLRQAEALVLSRWCTVQ